MAQKAVVVLWSTVASVVCGLAIASFLGGARPPWLWVGTLLVAAVASTAVLRWRQAHRHVQEAHWHERITARNERRLAAEARRTESAREHERHVGAVTSLIEALDETNLTWLHTTDFAVPWASRGFDPCAELVMRLEALVDGNTAVGLDDDVRGLEAAAAAFVSHYERNTALDPVISHDPRRGDWRCVDPQAGVDPEEVAEQLTALAEQLALAFEQFRLVWSPFPRTNGSKDTGRIERPATVRRRRTTEWESHTW